VKVAAMKMTYAFESIEGEEVVTDKKRRNKEKF
jgi:hypothetical protein